MPSCYCLLRRSVLFLATLVIPASSAVQAQKVQPEGEGRQHWVRRVRVAAYSPTLTNAQEIVEQAARDHVYGIEVDNDITGRYDSLLHPEEKLEALRRVALAAHARGNKVFVYVAGLECISVDTTSPHTVSKEHPEWLQRNITGQPALFDNTAAFWIAKGEEDAWISPFAPDWRKLYMTRIRQIAATGVDGIYVDIPYWMTHFSAWENTWASFDRSTVAEFHRQTGIDALKEVKLGDFQDPGFQKWVDFRIQSITEFLAEMRRNATSVNPAIALVPEIFPGIESEAVRVGADVYTIYPVVDAIAHEYEFGGGDGHTAALRSPFDWMMYQIGITTFRAFAGDRATWILNYSWDGAPGVRPADAMSLLSASELMADANLWDAKGHVMSGSNDPMERERIYGWLAAHQEVFSAPRQPLGSVGVYFSDSTRNRYPEDFIDAYRGTLLALMQSHRAFQIVTPRTLDHFRGGVLVLPAVQILHEKEESALRAFTAQGGRIVATGTTSAGVLRMKGVTHLSENMPQQLLKQAQANDGLIATSAAQPLLLELGQPAGDEFEITAPPTVVIHQVRVQGELRMYMVNFTGIEAGKNMVPTAIANITLVGAAKPGTTLHVLPFLGQESIVHGTVIDGKVSFVLPSLTSGAVTWITRS